MRCSVLFLFFVGCCIGQRASAQSTAEPKYVGTELTATAPYEWRDGAKLQFFKGKYWMIGGWTVGPRKSWGGDATTNEIWTSTDLINWKLEVPHIHFKVTEGPESLANTRFTPRHAFGCLVFNDYLWVIARDHMMSAPIFDVWRSKDGLTWECVLQEGLSRKRMPQITVYNGAIHVLGGETEEPGKMGESTATHFYSKDGVKWDPLPDMPFVRSSGGAVEIDGKLLVLGGNSGNTTNGGTRIRHNDVWAWDGKDWKQQIEHAPWPPMMWIDVCVYDNKVWVLAGRATDDPLPAGDSSGAWWSADAGKSWTYVKAPWPTTHADGVTATDADGIVMASGNGISTHTYRLKLENPATQPTKHE
jgi:hypothetical protein